MVSGWCPCVPLGRRQSPAQQQQQQQQQPPSSSRAPFTVSGATDRADMVQMFYYENRGKCCKKLLRYNGYPNKLAKGYVRRKGVLLLLQRNSNKSSLGSLELVEAPRRSPDEAFFPIPSTLFESAIASRASLLSTFRVLLSYTEKKELLGGTKYVQLKIKSMKSFCSLRRAGREAQVVPTGL
ncbi:hypothetical protein ALC53_09430 [Atta colombica]|uniref:Uncharacterized protein n=1 Tax=Atta colombica TaxID=520822 RepID=A0A195B762_9HYME|nr:hypothetical protein ALC53_09430 [Atta colombica]